MTQLTLILSAVIIASCCLAMGSSQAASTGPGLGLGLGSAKKVRILNPAVAANRVYRLLRYGAGNNADDDELLLEDDNNMQKRQYDDYGHMRFGKRQSGGSNKGDFDDYGHLRFGK